MNIVFLTHNKQRRNVDAIMKNTTHTVLGYEAVIRGTTVTRILDHHMPHCVVIMDDVQEKEGITKSDVITLLHAKRPTLRIVRITAHPSLEHLSFLKDNAVYDVIPTLKELTDVLNAPMTEADIDTQIAELEEQFAASAAAAPQDIGIDSSDFQPVQLTFPAVTTIDFDADTIERRVSPVGMADSAHFSVGIAQLQHHNGCTHTAFEIAALLSKKMSVCVVVYDPETYHNLALFHELDPERIKDGLKVHGIMVYPKEKMADIQQQYACKICDYSFLRKEDRKSYAANDVQCMLCSAAEWDISTTMKFINYPIDGMNVRKIVYLFPRVSKAKFIGYNKQMLRAGCVAYRLHGSEDWLTPCAENIAVYQHIMQARMAESALSTKKEKRGLLRRS